MSWVKERKGKGGREKDYVIVTQKEKNCYGGLSK